MAETMMVQCDLSKLVENGGVSVTTSWLPERFAKVGRYVKLKRDDDSWEDGWQVVSTGARMKESILRDRSQDYKRTRQASDI
jgi:hypothetical protein